MRLSQTRLTVVLSLLGASALACSHGESPRPSSVTPGGMIVQKDPVTGRFVPAVGNARPPAAAAVATGNAAPLVEVPSPYGGTLVDLQGRFTSHVIAESKGNGVRTRCVDADVAESHP